MGSKGGCQSDAGVVTISVDRGARGLVTTDGGGGGGWLSETRVFLAALTQFLETGLQPPKAPSFQPVPQSPTAPRARKAAAVQVSPKKCKVQDEVLRSVEDRTSDVVRKGYCLVYTDGSSKRTGSVRELRVGGYEVYAPPSEIGPELRISESLSEEEGQPNNAAEVVAAVAALRRFETTDCKICVVTDSEYVVLGAGGGEHTNGNEMVGWAPGGL